VLASEMTLHNAADRAEVSRALKCVSEIHSLMSGEEWSADTPQRVAEILNRYGWPCAEPFELNGDIELMHEVRCADGSTEMVSTEELMAAEGIFDRMKGSRR